MAVTRHFVQLCGNRMRLVGRTWGTYPTLDEHLPLEQVATSAEPMCSAVGRGCQ